MSRHQNYPSDAAVVGISSPDVGSVIATYRSRPIGTTEKALYGLSGLASSALFLVSWGVYSYAYTHYGPSAADGWSYPWFLVAWLMGVGLVLGVSGRLFSRRWQVNVYAQGIVIVRPLRQAQMFTWQQLSGVSTQMSETTLFRHSWGIRQQAWLFIQTGERLFLSEQLVGLPELVTRIKANLYPRLLPDLRVALRDERWVHFGPLAIHRSDGLQARTRIREVVYAWKQIKQLTIRGGYLVIELFERSRCFRTGEIPNLELLLQLIREELS